MSVAEKTTACPEELFQWLQEQANQTEQKQIGLMGIKLYEGKLQDGYLSVPVCVNAPEWGAVKVATLLQEIEDRWNYPEGEERPELMLLLVPVAR